MGQSMNVEDSQRHARQECGDHPEEAGFGRAGVDHIRTQTPQQRQQAQDSGQVPSGRDAPVHRDRMNFDPMSLAEIVETLAGRRNCFNGNAHAPEIADLSVEESQAFGRSGDMKESHRVEPDNSAMPAAERIESSGGLDIVVRELENGRAIALIRARTPSAAAMAAGGKALCLCSTIRFATSKI